MTDFLFAGPSIIEGIGRTIDFFGFMNEYNYSSNGAEADHIAVKQDIATLKNDMNIAHEKVLCGNLG